MRSSLSRGLDRAGAFRAIALGLPAIAPLALLALSGAPARAAADEPTAERVLDTITAERVEPDGRFTLLPRWAAPGRPTLALALSGGGAHGVAHLGVLEALSEDGVPIDAVAGTSVGALLGAFVAGGYAPEEVEAILARHDWGAVISGLDLRHRVLSEEEDLRQASPLLEFRLHRRHLTQVGALLESRLMERELYRYLLGAQLRSGGDFDRLRYRYRPVATDILTGRAVAPTSGDLVALVRGSFAIPGVFRPVPFGDALLVDGGLVENVPVLTARTLGADLVLAVDVTETLRPSRDVKGALDLLNRSVTLMMEQQAREALQHADIVLSPGVQDFPIGDFSGHVAGLVRAGRDAYGRARDGLWAALESRARDRTILAYDGIEVRGTAWITPGALAARLAGASGTASRFRVGAELARALNLGPFESGRVEWTAGPAGRRLVFLFRESPPIRRVAGEGPPGTHPDELGVGLPIGRPYSLEAAREVLWRTRQALVDRGRVLFRVDRCSWDPATGTLTLAVADEAVARITTEVSGAVRLERTERLLADLEGPRFSFDRLADRLDEMVARGAIVEWGLVARPTDDGRVELRAPVRGDDYSAASVGAAYRGQLGWGGFLRAAKVNLTGHGDFVDLVAIGAYDTRQIQARYRTEYGAGFRNLGAEAGVARFSNSFPLVDARQNLQDETEDWSGERAWVSLIRRMRWGAAAEAGLFRERDRLEATESLAPERLARTSLFLRLDLDRHDRLLFPTRGGALRIGAERSFSGDPLWKAELRADAAFSGGADRRQTAILGMGIGVSEDGLRRPFWFDPGGYRDLYGFIPYGAAAPEYALARAAWRLRLFDLGAARVYLESGADVVRTALTRGGLGSAGGTAGYGVSLVAHTRLVGPIAIGAARNDQGAGVLFVTAGFPLLRE